MKFTVVVKTRAQNVEVKKIDDAHFEVRVRAVPKAGEANDAVIRALAGYFKIGPSLIRIVRGKTARKKIVEIGP